MTDNTSSSPAENMPVFNSTDPKTPLISVNMAGITKLTTSNYITWRLQVHALLEAYELQCFIDETTTSPTPTTTNPLYTPWKRQDRMLYSAILGTLSLGVQQIVSRATTTQDIWEILAKTYGKSSRGHIKQIKQQPKKLIQESPSLSIESESLPTPVNTAISQPPQPHPAPPLPPLPTSRPISPLRLSITVSPSLSIASVNSAIPQPPQPHPLQQDHNYFSAQSIPIRRPNQSNHFVASPQTSILDTSKKRRARSKDGDLVLIRGRKVRIAEGASLQSLIRSWTKNGAHVEIQSKRSRTMEPLPKPAPLEEPAAESTFEDEEEEEEEDVKDLSEKDLLERHIERAKRVRARIREERTREMNRYKERLILLFARGKDE